MAECQITCQGETGDESSHLAETDGVYWTRNVGVLSVADSYNLNMALMNERRPRKNAPRIETGQEGLYLKSLSERQVPVAVKMRDGEVVSGWIEYFDDAMIRLTR